MLDTGISFIYAEKVDKSIVAELQIVAEIDINKLKLSKLDIGIIFVSEVKIQQLNKLYRKKDKVTDVLSFFYGNEGEIFICLKQAQREARDNKVDLRFELIKLVIHGFAHIAGHDHVKEGEYIKMNKVEKNIYDIYQKNI